MLILGKIIIRQNFRILASKIIKINERNYLFANNIRFYLLNYEKLNVYKLATSIQSRGVRNFRSHVFPNLFIHRGVIYLEEISNQIHYRTRLSRVFEIYYRLFSRKILPI